MCALRDFVPEQKFSLSTASKRVMSQRVTPGPLSVLRGHDDAVISLKYTHTGHLYSGAANGMFLRWDLSSQRPDVVHRAHEKSVISIDDLGGTTIATSSRDGAIKIWDSSDISSPIIVMRTGVDHFCNSCTAEIDGTKVLVTPGIEQSQIFVWDVRAPQVPVQNIMPAGDKVGMVTSLCSEDGVLFGGYEDGSILTFDIRSGSQLCAQKVHSEPVFALHARHSSKGLSVVSGGGDSILNRSKYAANSLTTTETISLQHPGTSCVRYRSDGRIVVSAHWDHSVRIYDQKRMKPLAVLKHHRDSVYAIEFLNNQAIPIADSTAATDGSEISTATGVIDKTNTLGWFATGSKDHTIALWNLFADSFTYDSS